MIPLYRLTSVTKIVTGGYTGQKTGKKGKYFFTNQGDSFDPSRHRIEPIVAISSELRQAITNQVTVEKALAPAPQPMPVQYLSLSNGQTPNTLIPGGMGKLIGERLRYDPSDPTQGIFLLDSNNVERRLPTDGIIMPGSLVFMVPTDLTPGTYRLEVRVRFDEETLSVGRLKHSLTVA